MSFKSNTGTIIDRAINELRTGRPLIIQNNKEYWMFFNIEHSQSKIFNQFNKHLIDEKYLLITCLLYTSPSPRDLSTSRMPSSA